MKYLSLVISFLFLVQAAPAKSCHNIEQRSLDSKTQSPDHCHSEKNEDHESKESSSENCIECLSFCCQYTVFEHPETDIIEDSNFKPIKAG